MMRLHNFGVALAIVCCASASQAAARKLSVEEAVQLALDQNPSLRGANLRRGSAHDAAKSVGARMLPSVHLSEEYQRYKDPFAVTFMPGLAPFQVRDVDNNSFVAAVAQPLLGLGHIAEDYLALRDQAAAGDESLKAARANLTEAVQAGYLRYFESRALAEIARWSEKELGEQVTMTQARLKAGVLTNADLLRVQVAAANARLQEIAAQSQAEVVRANLLAGIGLDPTDADVELVEPTALITAPAELPADRAAYDEALRHRPELARDRLLDKSAQHSKRARYLSLLPEIDGEAAYVRIDGQKFAPPESWFVGVKATWAVWEWGAGYFAARAAGKQAEAAAQDLQADKNAVATQVLSSLSQSRAAAVAVDVAEKTIASAQEAYRVTDALVKAGSATTTDLLDSQSALTGARLNLARARYEMAIQRVTLARVMGR
jgi:outer membrane protein